MVKLTSVFKKSKGKSKLLKGISKKTNFQVLLVSRETLHEVFLEDRLDGIGWRRERACIAGVGRSLLAQKFSKVCRMRFLLLLVQDGKQSIEMFVG